MHAEVVQIALDRALVLLGCESGEALFVDKTSQGRNSRNEDVYSEIKLKTVDQIWLVQIPLGNVVLPLHDPLVVPRQENTDSLARIFGFDYEGLGSLVVELLFEAFCVGW